MQHLAVRRDRSAQRRKFTHVAYRGGAHGDDRSDRRRGSISAGSPRAPPAADRGAHSSRRLAIVADKRSELVPDVPTTDEQGLPGINSHGVHFMMFAPASDAEAGRRPCCRLELKKIVGEPALKQRFAGIGFEPRPRSSEEMAAVMRKTEEDWSPVIKRLNIKLD